MQRLFSLTVMFLLAVSAFAADVSGTWKFTTVTPNGDQITATLKLQSEGSKVSGTIEADFPGKVTIDEGSLEGDDLRLKVTVTNEDGSKVAYGINGTLKGAEMKGIVEGVVDGEKIRMNWSATKG